jgi:hypothetical protein
MQTVARIATILPPTTIAVIIAAGAAAQASRPADLLQAPTLPPDINAALASIEDFSFSFSQPGFYAVLAHVKTDSESLDLSADATPISSWTPLLERPTEFRGLPVTVAGTVGRNTQWRFEQPEHQQLGPVWQLELSRTDQPIAITLILTEDAGDIPLGATIRVTGYFVMMRSYYSSTHRVRQAALLVAHGPTLIATQTNQASQPAGSYRLIATVAACTAAALAAWLVIRRKSSTGAHDPRELRASRPAPESLADDLAAWAARQPQTPPLDDDAPPGDDRP